MVDVVLALLAAALVTTAINAFRERRSGTAPDSVPLHIGILTVSDRAAAGAYDDLGGPAVARILAEHLRSDWEPRTRLVPDEQPAIEAALRDLVDARGCRAVFTTGGTGPAPRDVTPEATAAVCDRMLPGFGELMRRVSTYATPTAIMSRQTAGTRGSAVIVNLPGAPGSIADCLPVVLPAVRGCIHLLGGTAPELA